MRFDELNLPEPLLKAINDLGFETATPIQAQALPHVIEGKDVAGQAQTGSGKTACFLLGCLTTMLESERPSDGSPRAMVVAPTRELALQIGDDAKSLTTYTDIKTTVCCGGMSWDKQAKSLEDGTDIVVGTPGRLIDYLKRGVLNLRRLQIIVIDEADRMFDMGFVKDLNWMFRQMPPKEKRQSLLFSATLSQQVMRLAWRHMKDPIEIDVAPKELVVDKIEQSLFHVGAFEKLELMLGLLQREQPQRAMIFVNRKVDGEYLTWKLNHNGYEAVYISGDLPQKKRLRIVEAMKAGQIEILVATDVASRGIHVDDITHVFNYDVPQDAEDYVHRIGRTARAGREGKAITLACENTVTALPAITKMLGNPIPVEYAEDANFVPDRSGRYRRAKNVYTGWPPPSLVDSGAVKRGDGDEDDQDRGQSKSGGQSAGDGEPKKKRRRRRRRKPEGGASGASSGGSEGASAAAATE